MTVDLNTIYQESALATLARMPDAFLDCVITSPPYYGLRSYGTESQIWGGVSGCLHVFVSQTITDKRGKEGSTLNGRNPNQNENRLSYEYAFCTHCNAWRGELGLEPTFQLYIAHLIDIFREIYRVLKPSGSVWVNLGDSYTASGGNYKNGSQGVNSVVGKTSPQSLPEFGRVKDLGLKQKCQMNIPARFAIAMTDELQFIQRNEIIWHKPSCMPSSAKDRFTVDFEKIFFFTKSEKYYFEQQLEKTLTYDYTNRDRDTTKLNNTPGRSRMAGLKTNAYEMKNKRTVWSVNFEPSSEEHYASYPTKLIETPILAGCPENGIVYDPFTGTGTTQAVAHKLGRNWIGSELSAKSHAIATKRLAILTAQGRMF